jgi:hypothetical protein
MKPKEFINQPSWRRDLCEIQRSLECWCWRRPAQDYPGKAEFKKADALDNEIKTKYAGAIDHQGSLLVDSLKTLEL